MVNDGYQDASLAEKDSDLKLNTNTVTDSKETKHLNKKAAKVEEETKSQLNDSKEHQDNEIKIEKHQLGEDAETEIEKQMMLKKMAETEIELGEAEQDTESHHFEEEAEPEIECHLETENKLKESKECQFEWEVEPEISEYQKKLAPETASISLSTSGLESMQEKVEMQMRKDIRSMLQTIASQLSKQQCDHQMTKFQLQPREMAETKNQLQKKINLNCQILTMRKRLNQRLKVSG